MFRNSIPLCHLLVPDLDPELPVQIWTTPFGFIHKHGPCQKNKLEDTKTLPVRYAAEYAKRE